MPLRLSKKPTVVIQFKNQENVELQAKTDEDLRLWIEVLLKNKGMEPSEEPKKYASQSKGLSYQKHILGKAASSGMGKKVLREFIEEDVYSLLDYFEALIAKYDSPEKAKELRENMMKIAVKIALLYKNKILKISLIEEALPPIRTLRLQIISGFQMPMLLDRDAIMVTIDQIESSFHPISQFISPKNFLLVTQIFSYLRSPMLIDDVFTKGKYKELEEIAVLLIKLKKRSEL